MGKFNVQYKTNSYLYVGEKIDLETSYMNDENVLEAITYQSLNEDVVLVNQMGEVVGLKEGVAKIRVSLLNHKEVYFDYGVTVLTEAQKNIMDLALQNHNSNIFLRRDLRIGGVYDYDVIGSTNKILFTEPLTINHDLEENQKACDSNHGGKKTSTEFICVHYTGNMRDGADARANATYFSKGGYCTSIHYTTGNDGVFHVLDDDLVGFHAGDGHDDDDFYWRPTGVKVLESDPEYPVWGISENSKFTINGKETNQSVPEGKFDYNKMVNGNTYLYEGSLQQCINKMGLAFDIKDGEYYMGTTWWAHSQIKQGRICNKGGNMNSVGIESCVNQGSDLWYTWQKTAKLVAKLMDTYHLDIHRVVGHHFYTAKNCPQPMMENDLELWWEFIELVKAEYALLTEYQKFNFDYEHVEGNVKGENKERPILGTQPNLIGYKVILTDQAGQKEEVILYSVLNAK